MDAMEFIRERDRMCNTFNECHDGAQLTMVGVSAMTMNGTKRSLLPLSSGQRNIRAKRGRANF